MSPIDRDDPDPQTPRRELASVSDVVQKLAQVVSAEAGLLTRAARQVVAEELSRVKQGLEPAPLDILVKRARRLLGPSGAPQTDLPFSDAATGADLGWDREINIQPDDAPFRSAILPIPRSKLPAGLPEPPTPSPAPAAPAPPSEVPPRRPPAEVPAEPAPAAPAPSPPPALEAEAKPLPRFVVAPSRGASEPVRARPAPGPPAREQPLDVAETVAVAAVSKSPPPEQRPAQPDLPEEAAASRRRPRLPAEILTTPPLSLPPPPSSSPPAAPAPPVPGETVLAPEVPPAPLPKRERQPRIRQVEPPTPPRRRVWPVALVLILLVAGGLAWGVWQLLSTNVVRAPVTEAARTPAPTPLPPAPSPTAAPAEAPTAPTRPAPAAAARTRGALIVAKEWTGKAPVFVLHFSSHRDLSSAEKEAARLSARLGKPGHAIEVDLGEKGIWYRVLIGDFVTREEAQAYRAQLAAQNTPDLGLVYELRGE